MVYSGHREEKRLLALACCIKATPKSEAGKSIGYILLYENVKGK
jgi:hypothetical protein